MIFLPFPKWDMGADGEPKPHAHVMLTTREGREGGFGAKVREWKAQLGITIDTGRRLGAELAFNHGIDLGRGRGLGR